MTPTVEADDLDPETITGAIVGVDPRIDSGQGLAFESTYGPTSPDEQETNQLDRVPPSRRGAYRDLRSPLFGPPDSSVNNLARPKRLLSPLPPQYGPADEEDNRPTDAWLTD